MWIDKRLIFPNVFLRFWLLSVLHETVLSFLISGLVFDLSEIEYVGFQIMTEPTMPMLKEGVESLIISFRINSILKF